MSRIAIVGAGVAGLSAAWSLRTIPAEITVFEKSRGYAGRAATRGRYGVRYDHGANFIQPTSDRVAHLLTEELPTDDLVDIGKAVWTFTADGDLQPPTDPPDDEAGEESGAAPKWTYRNGINTVGKLLAKQATAQVLTETRVERLESGDGTWRVVTDDRETFGPFDVVVLTPPAPQTSEILGASHAADAVLNPLVAGLDTAEYASQFTVVLAYERRIKRAGDFYGLLSADEDHPIAWIGFEHDKPGHVPQGHSVVVIQMAPSWTAARLDADPDNFMPEAKEMAADVLNADLKRPNWYDTQRWRYSLPQAQADVDALAGGADAGLFFAGDYVAGEGRVGRAIESGLATADRVRDHV